MGLWVLVLLAFWHIGPAGRVVAGGDLFTYFYPYWAEATRALQAGRLPLWNPYLFMGVPFLANSQVGLLYPLNWPLWLLLPPHHSLHWSIIIHLCLAATGAYLYARGSLRLGRLGAWTAGAALALGGYLGAQVEHVNQLQALAWFPWLLALYDRAVRRRGGLAFVGLTATVGMVLLAGHTQSAFISLVGLGVYGLAPAAWDGLRGRGWRPLWRRTAVWAGAAVLAAALAAAQLLPTFQLARLSVRAGGLPFNERVSFSLSPVYLARALLPGYVQPVEPENIEYVATLGMSGLWLATCGLLVMMRRRRGVGESFAGQDSRVSLRGMSLLAGLGLFLALGLYNPLYLLLARFVPGFAHFRVPARWLALWAFGAAMLAGVGIERVARGDLRPARREWAVGGGALAVLLVLGALGGRANLATVAGWLVAAALVTGLVWLAQMRRPRGSSLHWILALGMVALVAVELLLSARTLPHARATAPQAYTSLRPAAAHLLAAGEGRQPPDRFLSLSALIFDPGDLPELRLIYGGQLSPDALYDLIVSAKHREVLSPNLPLAFGVPAVDGYDGGVLPLARYLALQRAFLPGEQVALDGRLRENLAQVPDGRWLSLFGVRYVITDKVSDAWIDDVFYDLQFGAHLSTNEAAEVAYVPPFEATALGLVSYLEGAAPLPDGTPVGEVTLGFADGTTRTFTLRAGLETAEGLYGPQVAHAQTTVGGHFWPLALSDVLSPSTPAASLPPLRTGLSKGEVEGGQPEGNDYAARLRWDEAAVPVSVAVWATLPEGRLVVRGVSLIDERTDSFQSLVLSDRGHFRLVHSGDVKVYENLDVLGRAFVAHRAWAVAGEEEALARMQAADFDPTADVVVEGGRDETLPRPLGSEQVRVVAYAPERVEVEADLTAPGYLVLTDAAYPGWRAWVDGEEVEVLTADLLFRAVRLEAGRHRVVFRYQPVALWVGIGVSLAAVGGLAGFLVVYVYNRNSLNKRMR